MAVNKLTSPISQNDLINKTNEIIDNLGGSGTVDQTYDPTSTNAQSGVAVAEALTPFVQFNDISPYLKNVKTDLSTPVEDTNLGSNAWIGVVYGNNKYIAIGFRGQISTSTDGLNWTETVQNATLGENSWSAIAFGNGKFFALGRFGYISTSIDGVTWETPISVLPQSGFGWWNSLTFGDGKFVAVSNRGYSTSTDGLSWTEAVLFPELFFFCQSVIYDGIRFVALTEYLEVFTSNNGFNWTKLGYTSGLAAPYHFYRLVYAKNKYIALSYDGYVSMTTDLINWTHPTQCLDSSLRYYVFFYNGENFIVISQTGYISTATAFDFTVVQSLPHVISYAQLGDTYFRRWSDGLKEQWNYRFSSTSAGEYNIRYYSSFTSEPMLLTSYTLATSSTTNIQVRNCGYSTSNTGFSVYLAANARLAWYARGY